MDLNNLLENILITLNQREKDIILKRYGIYNDTETLESIARDYNLSRERIRQIQNQALNKIIPILNTDKRIYSIIERTKIFLKPLGIKKATILFDLLQKEMNFNEKDLRIYRFFTLFSKNIVFHQTDENFYSFYAQEEKVYTVSRHTLKKIYLYLLENQQDIHLEEKIIEFVKEEIKKHLKINPNRDDILEFLKILKNIAKNPFNFWGLKTHKFISPNCLRDKIYLILLQEKRPLHFSQIYQRLKEFQEKEDECISISWRKDYNLESIKNELIRHQDFIFLGKGTYGLREWNLTSGDAKSLMIDFLKSKKQVTRSELWYYISSLRSIKKSSFYAYLKELKNRIKSEGDILIYND